MKPTNVPTPDFEIEMQWALFLLSERFGGGLQCPQKCPTPKAFLNTIQVHRVTPLVAQPLIERRPSWLKDPLINRLRALQDRNGIRALTLLSTLIKLKERLEALSIPFINLKGITLSQKLHDNVTTRSTGDIDIWVPEGHIFQVVDDLINQGYTSKLGFESLPPYYQRRFIKLTNHVEFTQGNINLEIHWRATPDHRLFPVSFEEAHTKSEKIRIQNHEFRILGKEHLLPYLLIHGASHMWERLQWLADITSLSQVTPDPREAISWARERSLETPTETGLHLTSQLLDIHSDVFINPEQSVPKHLTLCHKYLQRPPIAGQKIEVKDHFKNMLTLHPSWAYKMAFLVRQLYGFDTWKDFKIPPYLDGLYILHRLLMSLKRSLTNPQDPNVL